MGRVYEAEQIALGRSVALKVVHPRLVGDEVTAARFQSEARTASHLNHPNSVAVLDFGKTESGQHYLVMEFLRGRDLAAILAAQGPFPATRAADIGRQICAALCAAHDLGIVHRDVKPDNVMIAPLRSGADHVKVLDFGLATVTRPGKRITLAGVVCGTPEYISPEQCTGQDLDGRADVYSLGVVLYELLTGALPFEGDAARLFSAHCRQTPIPPRTRAPHRRIPAEMEEITMRALAKRPGDRWQTADEMGSALEEWIAVSRLGEAGRVCRSCGHVNLATSRFCAVCGERAHGASIPNVPTSPTPAPRALAPTAADERLFGCGSSLADLLHVRRDADRRGAAAVVVSEPGTGARTLVRELLRHAIARSDKVAWTGPVPSGAAVPFSAARGLLAAWLELDPEAKEDDARHAGECLGLNGEASGLAEAFSLVGAPDLDPASRIRAVGNALREVASRLGRKHRLLAVVERLSRCDAYSRGALAVLARPPVPTGLLLVGTHAPGFDSLWPFVRPVAPAGLPVAQAKLLVARRANGCPVELPESAAASGLVSPLYVEELVRFLHQGGTAPPATLVDLVAARVDLLPPDARLVLQGAAILGESCLWPDLWALLEDVPPEPALSVLVDRGFLVVEGDVLSFSHPLVADVVSAGIPASARAAFHERALEVRCRHGAPIAVRAHHAMQTQGGFQALLQIDLAGEEALRRGHPETAVDYYRRAIEMSRRALSGGDVYDPAGATIRFYCKLGRALHAANEAAHAAAILREGIELGLGGPKERALLLETLSEVLAAGGRCARTETSPVEVGQTS
jgi:serine/threonine-protein kinase